MLSRDALHSVAVPVLVVAVAAGGGPPRLRGGHRRHARGPALGFSVEIARPDGELLASSRLGNLTVEIEPGEYRVTAGLPGVTGLRPCAPTRTVTIRRDRRLTRVSITCSIR